MTDLITLAQAKQYLQIQPAQTNDDAQLADFVTGASQEFLTQTSLTYLAQTTFTERRNGTGTALITTKNRPLISITSLVVSNLPVNPSPDGVEAGFYFEPGGTAIYLVGGYTVGNIAFRALGFQGYPGRFVKGYGNVLITGTAGYPNLPASLSAIVPAAVPPSAVIYYFNPAFSRMVVSAGVTILNQNTNTPFVLVTGTPVTGEYVLNPDGTIVFAAADTGLPVLITFTQIGIPADVQKCVYEMVGWVYKQRDRIGKSSVRFADNLSESFKTTPFSDMSKLTIQRYTRKDPIFV
jgi:hypothetical protein